MDDATTAGGVRSEEVLSLFEEGTSSEPLTAREVAEAVGCTRRTAYDRLRTLAARGELRTKKVGARARVWWRDHAADVPGPALAAADEPAADLVEAEFGSRSLAAAFVDWLASDGGIRFDVAQDLPLPDGRRLQYYTVTGTNPRAVTAAFESFPSIESVRLVSTVGDVNRIEILVADDSVTEAIWQYGGWVTGGGVRDGEYRITAEFPAGTDTEAVAAAVREVYADMRVVSTRTVPVSQSVWRSVADGLTDRQRTVLRLAYHAGYFDSPRQSTGDDLADRLGITRQTLHHHLRRAEHAVFEWLFEAGSQSASDQ